MTSLHCGLLRGAELPEAVQHAVIAQGHDVDLRFLARNNWLCDDAFTALLTHPGTGHDRFGLISENSPLSPAARKAVEATGDDALIAHAEECARNSARQRLRGDILPVTRNRVLATPLATVARNQFGSELRATGQLLRAAIGDDMHAWQLALRLADTVRGTVSDLIVAVTGILTPAVSAARPSERDV